MAAEFIGHLILVTLASPPRAQVQGVVADVKNSQLLLRDGEYYSRLVIVEDLTDRNSHPLVESTAACCIHDRIREYPRPRSLTSDTRRIHTSVRARLGYSIENTEHCATYTSTALSRSGDFELQQTSHDPANPCASACGDRITGDDS